MRNAVLTALGVTFVLAAVALIYILGDQTARPAHGRALIAEHDGRSMTYYVSGPEQGRPVVLLASYARSVSDFNELLPAIHGEGYRSIAIESRGVGGSQLPGLRPSLFDYADDVRAVLDAEGLDAPLVIVGHAFGNRIARAFASRYPQRVAQLVLLAAGEGAPPVPVSRAISTVVFKLGNTEQRQRALEEAFFAPGNTAPQHWQIGWYPRAALAQAYATANTPISQWRGAGDVPVTVIEPQDDVAAHGAGEQLRARYGERVTVLTLANSGHAMLPEQLPKIAELLVSVLQAVGEE